MSLVRRSLVAGAVLTSALLGGSASASTGASQTITYTIVESRGVSLSSTGDGNSGIVSSSGPASRLTVAVEGGSAILEPAGGTPSTLAPGATLSVPAGTALNYRTDAAAPAATITFTVSAR